MYVCLKAVESRSDSFKQTCLSHCATDLLSDCYRSGTISRNRCSLTGRLGKDGSCFYVWAEGVKSTFHWCACVGCLHVSSGLNVLDMLWSFRQLCSSSPVPLHGMWIRGHEQHLSHWVVRVLFSVSGLWVCACPLHSGMCAPVHAWLSIQLCLISFRCLRFYQSVHRPSWTQGWVLTF